MSHHVARRAAIAFAALLSLASAGDAAAAEPRCPAMVADFALSESEVVADQGQRTLQCAYLREEGDATTSVSLNVTWAHSGETSVFVGAAPCESDTESTEGGSLSVASATAQVGSHVSASLATGGEINQTAVPPPFRAAVTALVKEAESVALPCDGQESAAPDEGPTPAAEETAAEEEGDEGISEGALLIAAGLILALASGVLPFKLLGRWLRFRSAQRAAEVHRLQAEVEFERLRRMPPPTPEAWGEEIEAREREGREAERARPAPPLPEPPEVPAAELRALDERFGQTVRERLDEGYWVRNPDLMSKLWNTIRHPFWGTRSGQCGEFAAHGTRWMRDHIAERFGPGAIVDEVYVARRSVIKPDKDLLDTLDSHLPVNHAATRVILPDGRRMVMDFWDAMGPGRGESAHLVPEREWAARWTERIPSGQVSRSEAEQQLRNHILDMGEKRGIEAFLRTNAADRAAAETLVHSWRAEPW